MPPRVSSASRPGGLLLDEDQAGSTLQPSSSSSRAVKSSSPGAQTANKLLMTIFNAPRPSLLFPEGRRAGWNEGSIHYQTRETCLSKGVYRKFPEKRGLRSRVRTSGWGSMPTPSFLAACEGPKARTIRLASGGSDFSGDEAGRNPPPPAADEEIFPSAREISRPMLPARIALTSGPKPRCAKSGRGYGQCP